MSRLDAVILRLRALPEDEHDAMAAEIESLLAEPASMLSMEQWAMVDVELAAEDAALPHAQVMTRLRTRFGR
jgi:hypothetical protein